jgi:hypothetical protein
VREGERDNGKLATAPLVWRFGNGEAIVEIISSSMPVVGNLSGLDPKALLGLSQDVVRMPLDPKAGDEIA